MIVALSLLLVAVSSDAETQKRVDELVARCHARDEIRLVAQGNRQVAMEPLIPPGEATAVQEHRFNCVLNGMKSMPDLSFGFIGNEEEPNGS